MWRPFLSHLRRRGRCAAAAGEGTLAAACCSRASSRQQILISPRAYYSSSSSETMAAAPPCNGSADEDLYQIRTPPWSENMHHPVGCRCCSSPPRRRHLYLILDEMRRGYGIYKLDLADLDGGDDSAIAGTHDDEAWSSWRHRQPPRRLPEAALRLSLHTAHFESLGGKIVVTGYGDNGGIPTTLVYDTSTAKLDLAKPPPDDVRMWSYHAVAAGDRLFALDAAGGPCYLCQCEEPAGLPPPPGPDDDVGRSSRPILTKRWAWKRGSSPSPLPHAYDGYGGVRSYAVHPDGRTVFISTDLTFSFATGTAESTARGRWCLPFEGRAYYDGDLGSWVGVRTVWHGQDRDRSSSSLHLCSCDVPDDDDLLDDDYGAPAAAPPLPAPEWKLCEQELTFRRDDVRSGGDLSRALVHTGRGRFCLVETWPTARSEGSCHCTCSGDGVEHLLHVTMFRAKHGKEGELVVSPCRPGRSYIMPNYCSDRPVAFWM